MRTREKQNHVGNIIMMIVFSFILTFTLASSVFAGEKKLMYTDTYEYTDTNGVKWSCGEVIVNDDGNETVNAVVYGCNNAGPALHIPSQVRDSAGNLRTVVGVTSSYEVFQGNMSSFRYSSDYDLAELYFPDTVFHIGKSAFRDYKLVNYIKLPDNAELEIGESAFQRCGNNNGLGLTVKFGTKPVTTGYDAFRDCDGITSLTLPENSSIGAGSFMECDNITEIINCPCSIYVEGAKLQRVVFDQTLTVVDGLQTPYVDDKPAENPFPALTTVTLPINCKKIGSGAFYNCVNLTTVNNLDWSKLEEVEDMAFYGCKNLKLTNVRLKQDRFEYQFKNSGLVSITLPANLSLLYAGGFTGCPNLTAINVEPGGNEFSSTDGILFCNSYKYDFASETYKKTGKRSMMKYPAGKNVGGSYTVPADVETIGGFTFEGCRLSAIHIPGTVQALLTDYMGSISRDQEYYPFDNTPASLAVYIVKDSNVDGAVQTMHSNVKYEYGPEVPITYNLNGGKNNPANPAKMRGGMTVILQDPTREGYTFTGWKTPDGTKAEKNYELALYGDQIFEGKTIEAVWEKASETKPVPEKTETIKSGNGQYVITKSGEVQFVKPLKKKATVTIPATITSGGKTYKVTSIAADAFKKDTKLRKLVIGKNVAAIGKNAFNGCSRLKTVQMGNKVTSIGAQAFLNCKSLTKIVIPARVKSIGKSAFKGCKKLKSITIKTTKLTSKNVKAKAFAGVPASATVKVPKKCKKAYKKWIYKKGLNKKIKIK